MEATTATVPGVQHYARLSTLQPDQFGERLDGRSELCGRITDVLATAVKNGEIEAWEFPEVERALGITFAALFNVQLIPTTVGVGMNGDTISQVLASAWKNPTTGDQTTSYGGGSRS